MDINNCNQVPSNYYNLNNTTPYQPPLADQNTENSYPTLNNIQLTQIPSQPTICNNQCLAIQRDLDSINCSLRSHPQYTKCPFCMFTGVTRTQKSYSIPSIAVCLCIGVFGWLGVQALRGKDINCIDAEHFCSRCNHRLGNYSAC
jgi:hypothetical protein